MNFNSAGYALLLSTVLLLYYALHERRRQNYMLLAAGMIFYGSWDHRFLFLLLYSSSVDYIGGLGIVHERPTRRNGTLFGASMLAATFILLAPIDWPAVWSAIVPADAFAGGWAEPTPWRGVFAADGNWGLVGAAYAALGVLLLTTLVGYRVRRDTQPRYFVAVSMVANLALLGFFKYFDFFLSSAQSGLAAIGVEVDPWVLGIIVPAGISFYTFQAMSYTIDVYRGHLRPTHHFPDYLLFVSFFPHLVAGPIQPANWLLPQLQRVRMFDWTRVQSGGFLIGWGLCKKIFIADNLTPFVAGVYTAGAQPSGPEVLFATYAFAVQIYADFSAYSDIARGSARLLGIELTVNFNLPYIATNPREFWRRWHISLSSWLRDYLYVPLGGGRGGAAMLYRNLLITMILGGLWHGARLNFLLWGIYQGALLCAHRLLEPWLERIAPAGRRARQALAVVSWAFFFHLICYGWLLFRAESASQIATMTGALATGWQDVGSHAGLLVRVLWYSWPIVAMQFFQARAKNLLVALTWPWPVRAGVYLAMFYLVVIFGAIDGVEFIYFQF
jgi:D-alanyl-lipoteichoic acid acyltransferase DltB (MBOAT superfamily)